MEVFSLALLGLEARPLRLRAEISDSSEPLSLLGLPEAAAREARLRVRAALQHLGIEIQHQGLIFTIEPADLDAGSALDLPIALSALLALKLLPAESVKGLALLGELSPDGSIRPVRGVLPRLQGAAKLGPSGAIVPSANAIEAALVEGLSVFAAEHVREAVEHLQGAKPLPEVHAAPPAISSPDLGLPPALRRPLEIAAAGGLNLLLIGSSGRLHLHMARKLPAILPPLSREEALEVTAIHSVAGLLRPDTGAISSRPFRAPHHTVSAVALLGGGDPVHPGEVSLAHQGVLYLADLHEIRRSTLDALARILDEGEAAIVRAKQRVSFPAKTLLVGAIPPCPCGFLGTSRCSCSSERIASHQDRLSGPLFDRFDLRLVLRPDIEAEHRAGPAGETCQSVQQRVVRARARQAHGHLAAQEVAIAMPKLSESERRRVLRVARTIADLDESETVLSAHVEEALRLACPESSSLA